MIKGLEFVRVLNLFVYARYNYIQQLRKEGRWTLCDARLKVINNFGRKFEKILRRASVKNGRFHDFRNTALTNWFANGLSEFEVMKLAGHSDFKTTHQFYLAVADDLLDRAREVTVKILGKNLAHIWHAPLKSLETKKADSHKELPAKDLQMGRGGIEPPTHGFSVRCSTN